MLKQIEAKYDDVINKRKHLPFGGHNLLFLALTFRYKSFFCWDIFYLLIIFIEINCFNFPLLNVPLQNFYFARAV